MEMEIQIRKRARPFKELKIYYKIAYFGSSTIVVVTATRPPLTSCRTYSRRRNLLMTMMTESVPSDTNSKQIPPGFGLCSRLNFLLFRLWVQNLISFAWNLCYPVTNGGGGERETPFHCQWLLVFLSVRPPLLYILLCCLYDWSADKNGAAGKVNEHFKANLHVSVFEWVITHRSIRTRKRNEIKHFYQHFSFANQIAYFDLHFNRPTWMGGCVKLKSV